MIGRFALAAALLCGAAPALAAAPAGALPPGETRIRNMSEYIEAVVDPLRGIYIQDYRGQWHYARIRSNCPRLNRNASLRFNPSPGGDFDRDSTIRADGWRCMVDSVTLSEGPPRRQSR